METSNKLIDNNLHKNKVHRILAHSYTAYFALFLIGVCLDFTFPIKIFANSVMISIGLLFLVFATFLIFWAQKTGHELGKIRDPQTEHFHRGPYRYTRMPTHLGLFLLMLGFGFVANAFFIIITTLISLVVGKLIFVEKQENILAEKYGKPYVDYKEKVKF